MKKLELKEWMMRMKRKNINVHSRVDHGQYVFNAQVTVSTLILESVVFLSLTQ